MVSSKQNCPYCGQAIPDAIGSLRDIGVEVFQRRHPTATAKGRTFVLSKHTYVIRVARLSVVKKKRRWAFYCGKTEADFYYFVGLSGTGAEVINLWKIPTHSVAGKKVINISDTKHNQWLQFRVYSFNETKEPIRVFDKHSEEGDMGPIRFKSGEFLRFTALLAFTIGEVQLGPNQGLAIRKGDVLEFDGMVMQYGGQTYRAPTVMNALRAGWLIHDQHSEVNADDYSYVPPSAGIKMGAVDEYKAKQEGREGQRHAPEIITQNDHLVSTVTQHQQRVEQANEVAWDQRTNAVPTVAQPQPEPQPNQQPQSARQAPQPSHIDRSVPASVVRKDDHAGMAAARQASGAGMVQEGEVKVVSNIPIRQAAKGGVTDVSHVPSNIGAVANPLLQPRPSQMGQTSTFEEQGVAGSGIIRDVRGNVMQQQLPTPPAGLPLTGAVVVDRMEDIPGALEPAARPVQATSEPGLNDLPADDGFDFEPPAVPEDMVEFLAGYKPDKLMAHKVLAARTVWSNFPANYPFKAKVATRIEACQFVSDQPVCIQAIFIAESASFQKKMAESFPVIQKLLDSLS